MSNIDRHLEAPCEHDEFVGRVEAGGRSGSGPYASAYTCDGCRTRTEGWAQYLTGQRATFFEGRGGSR